MGAGELNNVDLESL